MTAMALYEVSPTPTDSELVEGTANACQALTLYSGIWDHKELSLNPHTPQPVPLESCIFVL